MAGSREVAKHYTHGSLLDAIRDGIGGIGKTPETVTIDDLAPIDEFHIGGRVASVEFLDQLSLTNQSHVLDVGCGLGGPARFAASHYGATVTGIDLTAEFVQAGQVLCRWVGLENTITLVEGSALAMPFGNSGFDAAYMMHVGMNIADKETLFGEVARVLKPGATFGIYDVMQTGDTGISFPVPWAETAATSALASPGQYKSALETAGFEITAQRNRRHFALAFFAELAALTKAAGGPPPLGIHILMGESRAIKVKNMADNIAAGRIAPVELIARLY
ncbi:methyltransferase domain-containing protein [Anderseniella sp. Alg231-50]|uniref:methyltransferase domain-containing protein n=1 Tax=Anderseniella sp. Alg231-50 TaxID=1922226 RepID=UPI000D55587A